MSLHFRLVGIFQVDAVVELYIKVDLSFSKVADAECDHCALTSKCRVVLVLCILSSGILVDGVMLNHMKIILRFLTLDGDLITTVLLHALMEALDLIHG